LLYRRRPIRSSSTDIVRRSVLPGVSTVLGQRHRQRLLRQSGKLQPHTQQRCFGTAVCGSDPMSGGDKTDKMSAVWCQQTVECVRCVRYLTPLSFTMPWEVLPHFLDFLPFHFPFLLLSRLKCYLFDVAYDLTTQ